MHRILLLCSVVLVFAACSNNQIVDGGTQSLGETWEKEEVIRFELPELDTLQAYNVHLNLRNNHHYPYNNIYLIVNLEFPNGMQEVDTLQYRMAYPNGEWMGEGIGSIKESLLWYKEDFKFLEKGNYILSIEQAVRKNGEVEGDTELKGITDVGYRIENAENK